MLWTTTDTPVLSLSSPTNKHSLMVLGYKSVQLRYVPGVRDIFILQFPVVWLAKRRQFILSLHSLCCLCNKSSLFYKTFLIYYLQEQLLQQIDFFNSDIHYVLNVKVLSIFYTLKIELSSKPN